MVATITGEASLLRKLTIMPDRVKDQIRIVMEEHANEVIDMMRRLVPVDQGDLRDSIGWRWGAGAPKGSISVGTIGSRGTRAGAAGLVITIFAGNAKAYYSRWQEFGTVKMRAQPFFFVSWRASRKGAKNKIRAAVRRAAKQVAAGG